MKNHILLQGSFKCSCELLKSNGTKLESPCQEEQKVRWIIAGSTARNLILEYMGGPILWGLRLHLVSLQLFSQFPPPVKIFTPIRFSSDVFFIPWKLLVKLFKKLTLWGGLGLGSPCLLCPYNLYMCIWFFSVFPWDRGLR